MHTFLRILNGILASPFLALLWIYRRTLSPDHGPLRVLFPYGVCRHTPTCSTYAESQLRTKPLYIALPAIAWRVLRCNPWTKPSEEKLREAALRG